MGYRISGGPVWQLLKSLSDAAVASIELDGVEWSDKSWGRKTEWEAFDKYGVRVVFNTATETGETSSLHYHQHADNYFIMLSGCIAVTCRCKGDDDENQDVEFLTTSDVFCVPASQRHMFSVVEPSTFVEVYLAPQNSPLGEDDIIRL